MAGTKGQRWGDKATRGFRPSCARSSKPRKHKTPRAARKKQRKREEEGSGSRQEFRVKPCLTLMNTPFARPTPCVRCRKKRYHVTYDADPDNGRIQWIRPRNRKPYKTYVGYYCEHEPVGVEFRDRAGEEPSQTTKCERVMQGRLDHAFVESERIRCEVLAAHIAAQNRA